MDVSLIENFNNMVENTKSSEKQVVDTRAADAFKGKHEGKYWWIFTNFMIFTSF